MWYPDSAYKTATAINDMAKEDVPIMIFANWRGFSGGMMDSHEADCSATHPTSVITLHGTRDDVLSYDGGGGMVAAEDALAFWADHNGITGAPAEASDGSIDQLLYPTGDGGSAVHHYRYQGGGHVWFDDTYQGSDASALVWDFLTAFDTSGAL